MPPLGTGLNYSNDSTTGSTTTSNVWPTWNEGFTILNNSSTSVTSAATNCRIWTRWNTDYSATTGVLTLSTTGTSATGDTVWRIWNDNQWSDGGSGVVVQSAPRVVSPEEHRRQQERQRESRRKDKARRREREQAATRAEKLLLEFLSPRQRKMLKRQDHFHLDVHSRDGSVRRYQINRGFQGNVKEVCRESGRILRSYCIHGPYNLPHADQMLAQMLLLQNDEEQFMRIANVTNYAAA
jgi:hypothetical protein